MNTQIEDIYPLSPMQQGMLFHTLSAPQSREYFQQFLYTLEGDLDVGALGRAWQRITDRHPVLRSSFLWESLEEPLQIVLKNVELPFEVHDWRGEPAAGFAARLAAFFAADRDRGFDLTTPPLMRLSLLRVGDQIWELVWTFHHLLLDGWSVPIVVTEVVAAYEAFRQQGEPSLPPTRPYSEYIRWLLGQGSREIEAFWRQRLAGFRSPTAITPGAPLVRGQGADYDQQQIVLSASLTQSLLALARGQQLTLNTLIQGTWALLLARSSGSDDVLFGAAVSGRPAALPGADSMVGLFINTLPVRVRIDWEAPLGSWLRQIQEEQVEQRRYEHSSLAEIQGWSEIPRNTPLFDTLLVFENYPRRVAGAVGGAGGGLRITGPRVFERTNYPLTLTVGPAGDLLLRISHHRDRFGSEEIARLFLHLENLLAGMAADPARRLADLPFLSGPELHALRVELNDTADDSTPALCLHELFEAQAGRSPGAPALSCGLRSLTYGELDARADQLASRLRDLGVGPGVEVGLFAARSPEMVVGLLAVLKAGGAYLPLDPAFPRERLAFLLADSQVPVLLVSPLLTPMIPAHDARVVELQEASGAGPERSAPSRRATSTDLAYVIYTSGSTGRPKGVGILHAAVVNFLTSMRRQPGLGPGDRWLALTSLSFDIAALEIFLPLAVGAEVVLASEEETANPERLLDLLRASRATVVQATPATWRMLLDVGWEGGEVRCLCGGEALPARLGVELRRRASAVWNLYGPTETTIWSGRYRLPEVVSESVPIGRPIANTMFYLVDAESRLVPLGVGGELLIGGQGLARGYSGRPDLTAERFVPDPFSPGAGGRLYRTGDRVRLSPDGNLHFLGRFDHQVKLRGFRIELGEIEAVLAEHPGVRAVVVAHWRGVGEASEPRLVAYVVAASEAPPSGAELAAFLRGLLPSYMVPAVFNFLTVLPLTPNGKVDRRRLPPPEAAPLAGEDEYVAPSDSTEEKLAALWAEILGHERISVEADFFDLGGHSLLVTRLISRAREIFGVDLPFGALFAAPTVAALARTIRGLGQESAADTIQPVSEALDKGLQSVDELSDQQVDSLLADLLKGGGEGDD